MSHLFICELRIMAIGAAQNTTIDTCVDEKGDGSLTVQTNGIRMVQRIIRMIKFLALCF